MNINEIMSRAMFFYKNEDFEKTLNFLNKILSEDPNNNEVKEFHAKVKKRISLEPYINHFLEYSSKLYNEGRFKEAIEQAEKAAATDPESNKARLFLEKLKNESDHSSGIEPFSEDGFADDLQNAAPESDFEFEESGSGDDAMDDALPVVEQSSLFDQPFQSETELQPFRSDDSDMDKNQEAEFTSQDNFTFSIESDEVKTPEDKLSFSPSKPPVNHEESPEPDFKPETLPPSANDSQPIFEFPDMPRDKNQDKSMDEHQSHNITDEKDNQLSAEDFNFDIPADNALKGHDPFKAASHDTEKEKDIFDFEVETGNQAEEPDIEEAEIGFFAQKQQPSGSTLRKDSSPSPKSRLQTSEGLLNEFQRGLAIYKELNLKEALDIFTKILSYEKDFKDELPDLFEESRQLFLEIKSKLKDGVLDEEVDFTEPEGESFDDLMVRTQINVRKGKEISNIKKYTVVSISILAVVLIAFMVLRSVNKPKEGNIKQNNSSDVDFSHKLIEQQRAEQINKLISEASLLFSQGKEDQAKQVIDEILELDPENQKAVDLQNKIFLTDFLIKGQNAYDINNFKDAYEYFQKAYEINPDIPDLKEKLDFSRESYENNQVLYSRMSSYLQIKEKGDLNKTYRILSEIKKDYPDSKFVSTEYDIISRKKLELDNKVRMEKITEHIASARYHFNNGLYELAISEYRNALDLDPENSQILDMLYKSFYNTGIDALKRRDGRTAYWAFNESLKISPEDEESKKLSEFAFKNLERVTTPNYSDYVNSLGKKE